MPPLTPDDIFGFVRPSVDAHTLGISYVARLLNLCKIRSLIADQSIADAINRINRPESIDELRSWIQSNRISRLGLSYRLDPAQAQEMFGRLYYQLEDKRLLADYGGPIRGVYFAGLPTACERIIREYPGKVRVFVGDESPAETLLRLGVPVEKIPLDLRKQSSYDANRMQFGRELIAEQRYLFVQPVERATSVAFGTEREHLLDRVSDGLRRGLPPLIRAHVGPFHQDRSLALDLFDNWVRQLARSGLLDVLSIGTSQLTQAHFGEDWQDRSNGGGVPINSEQEYVRVWEAARPMLVRTYAGTRNIPNLAKIYERTLHTAWHALSFWWFNQIDGRGPNSVYQNLCEHLQTLDFISKTGKPFEPNIPHHFAFRGGDDVSFVLSAYLAAKTAKRKGIRCLILQCMLNTPKHTWGIQDLAKARAMLRMVRELEDRHFTVLLQPRAGLDYFSPDIEKAKAQLAAVTALMDDIEPENPLSPPIIHVVSYSEASHLADPPVIIDSIRIVRHALDEYRSKRLRGKVPDVHDQPEIELRTTALLQDARLLLSTIEEEINDPYTPEGLYKIFAAGFLPVPYLWERRDEFRNAVNWNTDIVNGGVALVDTNGLPIPAQIRVQVAKFNLRDVRVPYINTSRTS